MNLIELSRLVSNEHTPSFQHWTLDFYRTNHRSGALSDEIYRQGTALTDCLVSSEQLARLMANFTEVDIKLTNHYGFELRLNDDPTVDFQAWVNGHLRQYLPSKWRDEAAWLRVAHWITKTQEDFGANPSYWLEFDADKASIFYYPSISWKPYEKDDISYIEHTLNCLSYSDSHTKFVKDLIESFENFGGSLQACAAMISRQRDDFSRLVVSFPPEKIAAFLSHNNLNESILRFGWMDGDMLALDIKGQSIATRLGKEIRNNIFSRLDNIQDFVRRDKLCAIETWLSHQSPTFLRLLNNIKIDFVGSCDIVVKAYLGGLIL